MEIKDTVIAEVTSAETLRQVQITSLQQLIESKLEKPVELVLNVDESVLGGLRIYVDGYLIDYTIKRQLREMQADIVRGMDDESAAR